MGKTYRITIAFDEAKEADMIEVMDGLASSKKLGPLATNLIRVAYDNNPTIIKNMTGVDTTTKRTEFFEKTANAIKEQDKKIDAIYSMCVDMYGLARMNKVVGLEGKADNLLISQFVLQSQQNKLKSILGDGDLQHLYESGRLLNEKEKVDKIMEYIMEVYEGLIAELKQAIPVMVQTVPMQTMAANQESPIANPEPSGEEEYIDLPEKPSVQAKKDPSTLETPTGAAANFLMEMMDDM